MTRILTGNILSFCRHYSGEPFHAVLCDPPYHLTSIVKRFANGEPSHTKTAQDIANRSTPHARQAAGFMGKRWDGGDVAFQPETWSLIASVLYPGAFIFAFAGTRGYHRMAVAMEDAGLIIHPAIGWVFGSGFPKATRVDTQIDRAAGETGIPSDYRPNDKNKVYGDGMGGGKTTREYQAATPLAQDWQGHRYGLQALKPAFEFIAVAQVPYKGKPVRCIVENGAGALNIDASRIGVEEITIRGDGNVWTDNGRKGLPADHNERVGRWPANFLLSHTPDCQPDSCVDGCPIKMLDEQSGDLSRSQSVVNKSYPKEINATGLDFKQGNSETILNDFGDSGGASRFFYNSDWMHERLEESDPIKYNAKAGKSERNAGLDDSYEHLRRVGALRDGDRDRIEPTRNSHPTCKPISLCKYLATLLLPPDSYSPRRLLVPFSGSGSEMIGARLAGWECVTGVEMTREYVDIARARLSWWEEKLKDGHKEIDRMLAAWNKESEQENESGDYQTSIFDYLDEAGQHDPQRRSR